MTAHVWVRITILPIDVSLVEVAGGDETFHYTYTTVDKAKAEDESAFGCYLCDMPMTAETYHQPCTGVPDDIAEALLSASADDRDGHDGGAR